MWHVIMEAYLPLLDDQEDRIYSRMQIIKKWQCKQKEDKKYKLSFLKNWKIL